MIIRLLLFIALIAVIVLAFFWWIGHSFQHTIKSIFSASKLPKAEELTRCAVCQTFIPKSKAIQKKSDYYCCQEHANLTK